MQHLYEDILNIIYSKLSNGEIFLLKFVSKFFNQSIRMRISKRELLKAIIKTKNIKYIESFKNLVSKNIFDELLYRYSEDILIQIDKLNTEDCAIYGNLNLLKYLHKNNYSWNKHICTNAAHNGHLECLKYLHENGCPWSSATFF